jgi:hypothetical protein
MFLRECLRNDRGLVVQCPASALTADARQCSCLFTFRELHSRSTRAGGKLAVGVLTVLTFNEVTTELRRAGVEPADLDFLVCNCGAYILYRSASGAGEEAQWFADEAWEAKVMHHWDKQLVVRRPDQLAPRAVRRRPSVLHCCAAHSAAAVAAAALQVGTWAQDCLNPERADIGASRLAGPHTHAPSCQSPGAARRARGAPL